MLPKTNLGQPLDLVDVAMAILSVKPRAAHTPGAFRVETEYPYCGNVPRDFAAVVDEAGDELARINPNTPRTIALANAALFAAAPELLRTLGALMSAMERYEMDVDQSSTRDHRSIMDAARAAIAAATRATKVAE